MNSVETGLSTSSSFGFASFFSSPASTPTSTPAITSDNSCCYQPRKYARRNGNNCYRSPLWLVNACQLLEFLTNEHAKGMIDISAILITVGTLSVLPSISAGAGGAFLASGTAHALASLAMGLCTIMKA